MMDASLAQSMTAPEAWSENDETQLIQLHVDGWLFTASTDESMHLLADELAKIEDEMIKHHKITIECGLIPDLYSKLRGPAFVGFIWAPLYKTQKSVRDFLMELPSLTPQGLREFLDTPAAQLNHEPNDANFLGFELRRKCVPAACVIAEQLTSEAWPLAYQQMEKPRNCKVDQAYEIAASIIASWPEAAV